MSPITVTSASIILNVVGPTPAAVSVPMTRWWFTPIHPAMYPSPLAAGKVSLAGRHSAQRNYRPYHEVGSDHLGARLPRTNSAPIPTEDMMYTLEYVTYNRDRPLARSVRPVSDWQPPLRQNTIDLPGPVEEQLPTPALPPAQSTELAPTPPHDTPLSVKTASSYDSPFIPPAPGSEEWLFWVSAARPWWSTPDSDLDTPPFLRRGRTPDSPDSFGSADSASSMWALYSPSNAGSDGSTEEYSPLPNPYGTPLNFNVPETQTSPSDAPTSRPVRISRMWGPAAPLPIVEVSPRLGRLASPSDAPTSRPVRISRIPWGPAAPLPIVEVSPSLGSSLGFVVNVPPVQRVASEQDRWLDGAFCDSPEQMDDVDDST